MESQRISRRLTTRFTLDECNAMLPLVRAVAIELVDRRRRNRRLQRERDKLELAATPEGLTQALADLDARIADHQDAIRRGCREFEDYGLTVLRMNPLIVHFPGRTRGGEIVFCWREGETTITHGHPCGQEHEPGCPLDIGAEDSDAA